jgi:pyruvate/2-oxoglutarate dehydrogenase complex dihydrolipoamide acyltransferase (E2) component
MAQRFPAAVKRFNGTVVVTSVGMFGSSAGWGIPLAAHTLSLMVGGIERKPVIHHGELQNREHLCLTVSFDHDIVDGAPAARFIQRLVSLVQAGAGLSEPMPDE